MTVWPRSSPRSSTNNCKSVLVRVVPAAAAEAASVQAEAASVRADPEVEAIQDKGSRVVRDRKADVPTLNRRCKAHPTTKLATPTLIARFPLMPIQGSLAMSFLGH